MHSISTGLVYKGGVRMSKRIKSLGNRHFQNNFIIYFTITICFLIGVIAGSILINRLSPQQNYKLVSKFNWIFDHQVNTKPLDVFKITLILNLKFLLIILITGLTSLGVVIVPLMIVFRGGTIGFTVGYLIKEYGIKGLLFSLSGLLPHYLIILPGIIAIGAIGLSSSINGKKIRLNNPLHKVNQKNLIDYFILFLFLFLFLTLGCVIEALTTTYFLKIIAIGL